MLLLAGCGSTAVPPLPSDHPANPAAAEAPLPSPSQTLAIDETALPHGEIIPAALKPEMGGMRHDMGGMAGMGHDMKGLQHDHGMEDMKGMGGMKHVAPATHPGENAALSAPRWTPTTLPATTAASVYTCKMHPEVISNTPGNCPKCGMKLVIKEAP
jgi:hypothetical protein